MTGTAHNMLVSAQELMAEQGASPGDGLRLIDCRFDLLQPDAGREAWLAGHIPAAIFADLELDLSAAVTAESGRHPLPSKKQMIECFSAMGLHDDAAIVVYDGGNGAFAVRTWWLLRWCGHENVRLLDGGLPAWVSAGGELEAGEVSYSSALFTQRTSEFAVVDSGQIEEFVDGRREMLLLDARDAVRFSGEKEPIDAVAGHIPGAVNFPLGENIADSGLWKKPEILARHWDRFAGGGQVPPVAMCGSGVTACHLIFSACLAGRPPPALYAGSWSEWIRRPERPVAGGAEG